MVHPTRFGLMVVYQRQQVQQRLALDVLIGMVTYVTPFIRPTRCLQRIVMVIMFFICLTYSAFVVAVVILGIALYKYYAIQMEHDNDRFLL